MAIIHRTTMTPGKLVLLATWLPAQPWYRPGDRDPELAKAGGFRLDDPLGEVGIEFMVVTDGSGAVTYLVPMTYRASPLAGAGASLIGTAEHGVLGPRWIYDGTRDPVLVTQLVALIQAQAEPQDQNVSHTPDPTVTAQPVTDGPLLVTASSVTADGPDATDLLIETARPGTPETGRLTLRLHRILHPSAALPPGDATLSAPYHRPDGTEARAALATARYTQAPQPGQPRGS